MRAQIGLGGAAHVVGEEDDGGEDVDNPAIQLLPLPFPDLQLCLRLLISILHVQSINK